MIAFLLAHAGHGHWVWSLLPVVPILAVAIALVVAKRRDPGREERLEKEAEEQAEREVREILKP